MKGEARLAALRRMAFRPGAQGVLFQQEGPQVVLLSDVEEQVRALLEELESERKRGRKMRAELTAATRRRGVKRDGSGHMEHLFPETLSVEEEGRIRRACSKYGADFHEALACARLYSERGAIRYASWPAAIEVAMRNGYDWIRPAMESSATGDRRRDQARSAAQEVMLR